MYHSHMSRGSFKLKRAEKDFEHFATIKISVAE